MGDVVPDFVKDCRLIWLGLLYPWICYQYVVPKRRYITTNLGCITSQKSEGRIYIAAEAWNHTVVYQSLSDRLPFEWSSKKFDLRLIYIYIYINYGGRDLSVRITTCYGLDDRGIKVQWGLYFPHPQTGPGAHPDSHTMDTRSLPVLKQPGCGVDHPLSPSAEIKE